MGKTDRHHVHSHLDHAGFDGTHKTERTYGEPQTLVITKRNSQGEFYNAWLGRCREAHALIESFDAAALQKVVSVTGMQYIKAMRLIINDPSTAPDFLPRFATNIVQPPEPARTGQKRKAEVIDLSADSD